MRRLLLIAIVTIGLAPGTWVRSNLDRSFGAPITVTALETRAGISGPLRFKGAWEIASHNAHFGGYSALALLPNGNLYAGTDRGRVLELILADGAPLAEGAELDFLPGYGRTRRGLADLEAFTRDPATGTLWAAYEHGNVLERIGSDGVIVRVEPPEMASWSRNSGPEAIVRLADGRFVVLGEAPEKEGLKNRPGLLFDGDPLDGAEVIEFRFKTTPGFSPVDAALLPDGDVMILERRVEYSFPATFDARLVRADPSEIAEGEVWTGDVLQTLVGRTYGENFEGLEFVPDEVSDEVTEETDAASGSLYLIADDNLSAFQRTILVRFAWPPDEPGEDAGRPQSSEAQSGEATSGADK